MRGAGGGSRLGDGFTPTPYITLCRPRAGRSSAKASYTGLGNATSSVARGLGDVRRHSESSRALSAICAQLLYSRRLANHSLPPSPICSAPPLSLCQDERARDRVRMSMMLRRASSTPRHDVSPSREQGLGSGGETKDGGRRGRCCRERAWRCEKARLWDTDNASFAIVGQRKVASRCACMRARRGSGERLPWRETTYRGPASERRRAGAGAHQRGDGAGRGGDVVGIGRRRRGRGRRLWRETTYGGPAAAENSGHGSGCRGRLRRAVTLVSTD